MDVLVYSGPGVSPTSVAHTLTSLRTLLSPNYSVQTVTASALTSHPWTKSCALLVIPGGRDVPYTSALKDANRSIRAYVEGGGSFLGFCAGAYYASQRVEWEAGTPMEVVGDRELGFYPGICEGCVYPGFQYQSEEGARPVKIRAYISHEGENIFAGLYYNGGGHFVDAASFTSKGVRILAVHADEDGEDGKATAVVCDVGLGRAILWNIHIEFPFTTQPALACLSKISPPPSEHLRSVMEKDRWTLLRHTLDLFGLNTTKENPPTGVILSPQHMSFSPYRPGIINAALPELQSAIGPHLTGVIEDIKDTFRFHPSPDLPLVVEESKKLPIFDMSEEFLCSIPKHIIIFKEGAIPSPETTPLFNHIEYYKHLASAREQRHLTLADPTNWASGEILLYGETVTSTQTLLDKNPTVLGVLPSPLLSLASHQISARGRGQNTWVAPHGCLQMSLRIRPPPNVRVPRLVFVQYLFGLAVVEACREVMGEAGEQVRLKWPNDIYAVTRTSNGEELKKIGGVLVSNNFSGGQADLIIGCGLNVLNPKPTISLQELLPSNSNSVMLTLEKMAATIMAQFDGMWSQFVKDQGFFDSFIDLYLERWLHSDQLVTVTSTIPSTDVRIVGITPDHGLLRTIPVKSQLRSDGMPEFVDLQPDGNSFDMMAGLIKTKT